MTTWTTRRAGQAARWWKERRESALLGNLSSRQDRAGRFPAEESHQSKLRTGHTRIRFPTVLINRHPSSSRKKRRVSSLLLLVLDWLFMQHLVEYLGQTLAIHDLRHFGLFFFCFPHSLFAAIDEPAAGESAVDVDGLVLVHYWPTFQMTPQGCSGPYGPAAVRRLLQIVGSRYKSSSTRASTHLVRTESAFVIRVPQPSIDSVSRATLSRADLAGDVYKGFVVR